MTNQQILEKAIQKAIDGGWVDTYRLQKLVKPDKFIPSDIIFNHDFARALWGGQPYHGPHIEQRPLGKAVSVGHQLANWQDHLQAMVIADDPIKYLGENI